MEGFPISEPKKIENIFAFLRNLHVLISIINNMILYACFLRLWTILWAFGMQYKLFESPLCQVPLIKY